MFPNKRPKRMPDDQPPEKKASFEDGDCEMEESCARKEVVVGCGLMGDGSDEGVFSEEPVVGDIAEADRWFGFDGPIVDCHLIEWDKPSISETVKLEDGTTVKIEPGVEVKQEPEESIEDGPDVPTEDNPGHPTGGLAPGVVAKQEPKTLEDPQPGETTEPGLPAEATPMYFIKHGIGFYREVELESPIQQKPEPQPSGSRQPQPAHTRKVETHVFELPRVHNEQWTCREPQPPTSTGPGTYNEQWTFREPSSSSGPGVYSEPHPQPSTSRERQPEGLRLRELEFLRGPQFGNFREPPPAHFREPQPHFREPQFGVLREPPPAHYREPQPLHLREPHFREPQFGVLREHYREPQPAHLRLPQPAHFREPQPGTSGFPRLPQYGLYGIQAPLFKGPQTETRPGAYGMQEREHCRGPQPGTSRDPQTKSYRELQPPPGVSRESQPGFGRPEASRSQPGGINTVPFSGPQTSTFRQPPPTTYRQPPFQMQEHFRAPPPQFRGSQAMLQDTGFFRMSQPGLAISHNPGFAIMQEAERYYKQNPGRLKKKNSSFASREELDRYLRSEQAMNAAQFPQGDRTADPPAPEGAHTSMKVDGDETQRETGTKRRNDGGDEEETVWKKQKWN